MRRGATLLIVLVLIVAGFAAAALVDSSGGSKCSCPAGRVLSPSPTTATLPEAQPDRTTRGSDV